MHITIDNGTNMRDAVLSVEKVLALGAQEGWTGTVSTTFHHVGPNAIGELQDLGMETLTQSFDTYRSEQEEHAAA